MMDRQTLITGIQPHRFPEVATHVCLLAAGSAHVFPVNRILLHRIGTAGTNTGPHDHHLRPLTPT